MLADFVQLFSRPKRLVDSLNLGRGCLPQFLCRVGLLAAGHAFYQGLALFYGILNGPSLDFVHGRRILHLSTSCNMN